MCGHWCFCGGVVVVVVVVIMLALSVVGCVLMFAALCIRELMGRALRLPWLCP